MLPRAKVGSEPRGWTAVTASSWIGLSLGDPRCKSAAVSLYPFGARAIMLDGDPEFRSPVYHHGNGTAACPGWIMPPRIPRAVKDAIKAYLREQGNSAQTDYAEASGSEDTLTGAFGKHLKKDPTGVRGERGWKWRIRWRKVRSSSRRSAEEKHTGADGIIQLEVFHADGNVFTKGLLFQAKKEDDKDLTRLKEQCGKMEKLAPSGSAIFVYGSGCYFGRPSTTWDRMSNASVSASRIGDFLADEFMDCRVGQEGLFYEAERGTLVVPPDADRGNLRRIREKLNKIAIEIYEPTAVSLPPL